jgi:hypothetical protein
VYVYYIYRCIVHIVYMALAMLLYIRITKGLYKGALYKGLLLRRLFIVPLVYQTLLCFGLVAV